MKTSLKKKKKLKTVAAKLGCQGNVDVRMFPDNFF